MIIVDGVIEALQQRRLQKRAIADKIDLSQCRRDDFDQIYKWAKEFKHLLIPWNDIIRACLEGKNNRPFLCMRSVSDFIDGFQVNVPSQTPINQVERYLRDFELDVMPPIAKIPDGCFWIQLANGPFNLLHNLPLLA